MDLRAPMTYGNLFAQLTTEAAKNAARDVICQPSERLTFSKYPSKKDKDMECLQFGICSYQAQGQPQRVNLYNSSNEIIWTDFNILSIITDTFSILFSRYLRKEKLEKY